ncbi:MAG: hypothetical protein NVS2B16_26490 [Chloroflexota bacterium]
MEHREFEIRNEHGLHARPAALFVQTAAKYSSRVTLRNLTRNGKDVNAKSIMEVLTAGIDQGSRVQVEVEGDDECEALEALANLLDGQAGS